MLTYGYEGQPAGVQGQIPMAVPVDMGVVNPQALGVANVVRQLNDPGLRGLVVRQQSNFSDALAECIGVPYNVQTGYAIKALPNDKQVKHNPSGDGWTPTAEELKRLDQILFAQEESGLAARALYNFLGMSSDRSFKMSFYVNEGGQAFILDRPFRCGGCCGCPLEMSIYRGYEPLESADGINVGPQVIIGRIAEDWDNYCSKLFAALCCDTYTHKIQRAKPGPNITPEFETAYFVVANRSCCNGPNNCCAPSCCRSDAVFNIYDAKTDEVVGRIQKTFAGEGDFVGACLRNSYGFDNYVIEFPADATTAEDRMLILTSVIQIDFQLYEQRNDSNKSNNLLNNNNNNNNFNFNF